MLHRHRHHPTTAIIALFGVFVLLLGISTPTQAQFDSPFGSDAVQTSLIAEHTALKPGQTTTLAVHFELEPGWHLYWTNPEGAGFAPSAKWNLPEGYQISGPIWPAPHTFVFDGSVQFGYEDQLVLLYEITPPADAEPGKVQLKAKVSWLACKTSCIPGDASLSLDLPVADKAPDDAPQAGLIRDALGHVPATVDGWSVSAQRTPAGYTMRITAPDDAAAQALDGLYFFSDVSNAVDPAAKQAAEVEGNTVTLTLKPRKKDAYGGDVAFDPPLTGLTGVLTAKSGFGSEDAHAIPVKAEFGLTGGTPNPSDDQAGSPTPAGLSHPDNQAPGFILAIGLALLGGVILNLMPCVFPVLSIKILGFVQQSGENPAIVRRHGYAFGAGVLVSFWVLVGVLLALRGAAAAATGDASSVSWGFQLQNPIFVLLMVVLVFLIGMNLIGAFEIGIGLSAAAGRASQTAKDGYGKSFFTGVLATLIATPCTGPFMAPALGAALAMPVLQAVIVFTALGVGMATPYVVLSCFPRLLNYLPRPGAWMESFKQAMAFPMFATAGAGVWIYAGLTDEFMVVVLLIALSIIGMGAWVYGRWSLPTRTPRTKWIARIVAIFFVCGGILATGLIAEKIEQARRVKQQKIDAGQYVVDWVEYSPEKVNALQAEGRPVLVDFTARWCAICQTNKLTSLRTDSAEALYEQHNVALVEADYTRKDPMIGKTLEQYQRGGVPLYLVFPADGGEPEILPNTLTPQIIEAAIQRASGIPSEQPAALSSR